MRSHKIPKEVPQGSNARLTRNDVRPKQCIYGGQVSAPPLVRTLAKLQIILCRKCIPVSVNRSSIAYFFMPDPFFT